MLKMVIRIDENKVLTEKKYRLDGIYSTINCAFMRRGFKRQASEKDALVYCSNGKASDFASFGIIVNTLKRETWFLENITEWSLYESEDSDNPDDFSVEDLLARYRKKYWGLRGGTKTLQGNKF